MGTCFAYDSRTKTIFKIQNNRSKKFFINVVDEKRIGKVMELNSNSTLMCIRVKDNQLKVITDLDNSRFRRFETIKGIEAPIVQFKFYDENKLAMVLDNGVLLLLEIYHKSHRLIKRFQLKVETEIEKIDCFDICRRKQFIVICTSSREYSSLKKMQVYSFDASTSEIILASERNFARYLALGDTPSFSSTKKSYEEEYSSHQTAMSVVNKSRNKYGEPDSANNFSCVYIDCYKDAKPVIVAYQKDAPYGLFIGIFTGIKIEEIRYYKNYHTYPCYQASYFNDVYYSLGEANMMKTLKIINTNL